MNANSITNKIPFNINDVLKSAVIIPVGMAVLFLMNLLLAKVLGAKEFGSFSFAIQLATILAIVLSGGLANSMQKKIPEYVSTNDSKSYKSYMSWSFTYLWLVLLLLSVVWISPFGSVFVADSSVSLKNILLPTAAFLFWLWQRYYYLGKNKIITALLYRDLIFPILVIAYIWIYEPTDFSQVVNVYSFLLITVILLPFLCNVGRFKNSTKSFTAFTCKSIGEWHATATPMAVTALMQLGLNSWDIILIGIFVGMADAGIYSIAFKLALVLGLLARIVNVSLSQRMSALYSAGQHRSLEKLVFSAMAISAVFGVLFFMVIVVFGEKILAIIGDDYGNSYRILVILSIGQFFICVTGPVATYLNMTIGQKRLAVSLARWSLVAVLINSIILQFKPAIWAAAVSVTCIFMMKLEQLYHIQKIRKPILN